MAIEINTKVSVGQSYGAKGIPNITLEDAKFFGRPNFAGEMNRFKETKRQFTVLIPNDVADQLRQIGYNVKTNIPTQEELAEFPDREPISHLKVAVDEPTESGGSAVYIKMGETGTPEKLTAANLGAMDRARIHDMDMEIRGWMYNQDEVNKGIEQPLYSARLVTVVANIQLDILGAKYGIL